VLSVHQLKMRGVYISFRLAMLPRCVYIVSSVNPHDPDKTYNVYCLCVKHAPGAWSALHSKVVDIVLLLHEMYCAIVQCAKVQLLLSFHLATPCEQLRAHTTHMHRPHFTRSLWTSIDTLLRTGMGVRVQEGESAIDTHTHTHRERERGRERGREAGRQGGRQGGREAGRQGDRETGRQEERESTARSR